MAFTLPTFNLLCDIYTGPWLTRALRLSAEPCNLAFGRRVQQSSNIDPFEDLSFVQPTLLLNAGVDVRSLVNAVEQDVVECPSGSGRWYQVIGVDDIGKGFANEHRAAILQQIFDAINPPAYPFKWPAPMP